MSKKTSPAADYLDRESERFTEVAKEILLSIFRNEYSADVERKKRLANDHLVRSETYRTAATIVRDHALAKRDGAK